MTGAAVSFRPIHYAASALRTSYFRRSCTNGCAEPHKVTMGQPPRLLPRTRSTSPAGFQPRYCPNGQYQIVNAVSDRVRAELLRRIGLADLLAPRVLASQSDSG
jgi:hypothetical protein